MELGAEWSRVVGWLNGKGIWRVKARRKCHWAAFRIRGFDVMDVLDRPDGSDWDLLDSRLRGNDGVARLDDPPRQAQAPLTGSR